MEIKLKLKGKFKVKEVVWIRRFRLRKNLGIWGKWEQDDLHKSTCHPRGTGKTRVLGKRWENMSEKLECSSHWLNFWETAWYMNNWLVRPRHIGLTNCERKVHILWGPGLGDLPEFTLGRQCSDSFARARFTKLEERSEKTD